MAGQFVLTSCIRANVAPTTPAILAAKAGICPRNPNPQRPGRPDDGEDDDKPHPVESDQDQVSTIPFTDENSLSLDWNKEIR